MSFSDPNFLLLFALIHNEGYRENVIMVTERMQLGLIRSIAFVPNVLSSLN